jgi:hypothetical protein
MSQQDEPEAPPPIADDDESKGRGTGDIKPPTRMPDDPPADPNEGAAPVGGAVD